MTKFIRWVVYVISVAVSRKYAAGYWVVGPVFGAAVVFCDSNSFKGLKPVKHLAFLAASSLIYALVFWIADLKWSPPAGLSEDFFGTFPLAVITGSLLLPVAHKFILGAGTSRAVRATLALILSFYFLLCFEHFSSQSRRPVDFDFMTAAIALWQGLYLYLFYKPERIKKEA